MLAVEHVWKRFRLGAFGRAEKVAVADVSFGLAPGEVLSIIGESGSGKSTIGRMVLRLLPVSEGRITVDGTDISSWRGGELKEYYRRVQGVFQDPFSTYNPVFRADRVFSMVRGQYFRRLPTAEWDTRVERALADVRLDPRQVLGKYPHQLSGGQLQRMLIARALLLEVQLLVADEIISMLDASTRIDVLNLLADLKAKGLGVLFVTHDLALGNYISERTMIMHLGRVVELGPTDRVLGNPQHPYSRRLVASVPRLDRKWSDEPDEGGHAPDGCPVHAAAAPESRALVEIEPGHLVGCFASPDAGCPAGAA
ncbi:ABC transporter ATP-binding protein [Desertimonas flava]|uniref:ABC transporter ATP-binding protein n=1 Tax=Desertimonas flava TaxID=2064846 RepID=UPI000E34397C|nr:ABC transporter ATP-binding protein [Desertimonas flava]